MGRYSAEIKEISMQKQSLKHQVDEYEQKIKNMISEIEAQSRKHMKEINEMHEHCMGFKSQATELKSRIGTYKSD